MGQRRGRRVQVVADGARDGGLARLVHEAGGEEEGDGGLAEGRGDGLDGGLCLVRRACQDGGVCLDELVHGGEARRRCSRDGHFGGAAGGGLSAVEGDVALAEEVEEGPVVRRRDEVVEGRDGLVVGVELEVAEEGAVDDVLGGGSSPP